MDDRRVLLQNSCVTNKHVLIAQSPSSRSAGRVVCMDKVPDTVCLSFLLQSSTKLCIMPLPTSQLPHGMWVHRQGPDTLFTGSHTKLCVMALIYWSSSTKHLSQSGNQRSRLLTRRWCYLSSVHLTLVKKPFVLLFL